MNDIKSPAFQFYPSDYLDKKVMRMSYEAQGVYMRILCHMWRDSKDQCSIENDFKMIANILGLTRKKIEKIFTEILWPNDPIFEIEGEKLISKRLRQEKEKQINNYEKRRSAAEKRWEQSTCNADAKQCSSSSSSSSTSSSISSSTSTSKKIKRLSVPQNFVRDVVEDLNQVLGLENGYKTTSRKNIELIQARLNDGFTLEDFQMVHRKKFKDWGQDPKMAQFLRPVTLWGTKFESYLNQLTPKERSEMQILFEKTMERYGHEAGN